MWPNEIIERVMKREFPDLEVYVTGPFTPPSNRRCKVAEMRVYLELRTAFFIKETDLLEYSEDDFWEKKASELVLRFIERVNDASHGRLVPNSTQRPS